MTSLSFPDSNVWLALASPEHVHASFAKDWWQRETGAIAFCRLTQLGFLRLMTTAAVMDGKPLTITEAWRVYDRLYDDDRVTFVAEPPEVDKRFRQKATGRTASPKVWADAWLLAVADAAEAVLVTFDKALALRGALCLLPNEENPLRPRTPRSFHKKPETILEQMRSSYRFAHWSAPRRRLIEGCWMRGAHANS